MLKLGVLLSVCSLAGAATLFQRDLPTAGINLAGAARSNIAPIPPGGSVLGDDFTLAAGPGFIVDSITVWIVGNCSIGSTQCAAPTNTTPTTEFSSIQLYGGLDNGTNGPVSLLSSTYTSTRVQYNGTTDYLSPNNGLFYPIFQLTFANLGLFIPGGQLYDFAVNGTPIGNNTFALHSSTAGISGGTQQGADNLVLVYSGNPLFVTGQAGAGNFANFTNGADVNVLVTGAAIPEPGTIGMLSVGLGMLAFGAYRRRRA
jgi:hypothetical protein